MTVYPSHIGVCACMYVCMYIDTDNARPLVKQESDFFLNCLLSYIQGMGNICLQDYCLGKNVFIF